MNQRFAPQGPERFAFLVRQFLDAVQYPVVEPDEAAALIRLPAAELFNHAAAGA
jgi:hypothetical protein